MNHEQNSNSITKAPLGTTEPPRSASGLPPNTTEPPLDTTKPPLAAAKGRSRNPRLIVAGIALALLVASGAAWYLLANSANQATKTETSSSSGTTTGFTSDSGSSSTAASDTSDAGVGTPNFNGYAEEALTLTDGENLITEGKIYTVTGNISGYIHVNIEDDKNVKLVLSSVSISSNGTPAIFVENAKNVVIELVGENTITTTVGSDHPGAIFSKDDLLIQGDGSLSVTSSEDAIVSKDDLEIASGNITISCADDAIRGNDSVKISGGNLNITRSKEGIEGEVIVIAGGNISVTATDDGINAADKNGEGNALSVTISGGTTYVNSGGDGLDSNGNIYISGGTTYVDGPLNDGNGPIDYEGSMQVTGGTLIAVGSAGMAMNATSATQPSILVALGSNVSGELSIGNLSYTPQKSYASVYVTSPDLKVGETYELKAGSTTTSVTVSQAITNVGTTGTGMGGGMPGGDPNGGSGANGAGGPGNSSSAQPGAQGAQRR